jgi:peroxiredoxin
MNDNKSVKLSEYNYPHFNADYYEFEEFTGLIAGEQYIDFELRKVDGKSAKISNFLDKPLVFEMGSVTCPMYAGHVTPMQEIAKKYPEFNFVVLYVREAHPGNRISNHTAFENKIDAAKEAIRFYKDNRTILVDNTNGEAHKVYGTLPNSVYVIDTDGKILFAKAWNNTNYLEPVLEQILNNKSLKDIKFKPAQPGLYQSYVTLYKKGGRTALYDFVIGLPKLIWKHLKAGNLF